MADFQSVVSFDQIAKSAHFDSGDEPLLHLPIEAKKAQDYLPAVVGETHEQLPPAPRSNRPRFDNLALDLPRGGRRGIRTSALCGCGFRAATAA